MRNGEGNGRDGSSVKTCESTKSCRQKPTQTYPSPSRSLSSTAVDNESTITTTAYELASTPATPISSNCGCPCHKPGTTPSPLRLGELIAESRVNRIYKHATRRHLRHMQNMQNMRKLPSLSTDHRVLPACDARICAMAGRIDPFGILPKASSPHVHKLMHHCKSLPFVNVPICLQIATPSVRLRIPNR